MSTYDPNFVYQKTFFVVGQKAIILNDQGQVLLLLRSQKSGNGGTWSLPGGALEAREDTIAGIRREILEETGFKVRDLLPFHTFSQETDDGESVVMIGYTASKSSGTIVLNWEHDDFQWCALEKALALPNLSKHGRIFLEEYQKQEHKAVYAHAPCLVVAAKQDRCLVLQIQTNQKEQFRLPRYEEINQSLRDSSDILTSEAGLITITTPEEIAPWDLLQPFPPQDYVDYDYMNLVFLETNQIWQQLSHNDKKLIMTKSDPRETEASR